MLKVDFSKTAGKIKPMNAVNNGPTRCKELNSPGNVEVYKNLEIPYARNHDASFYSNYGGEYSVDVHRIFPDFDADENDINSYLFTPTDNYIESTFMANTETFYRLGARIEHRHKKGTFPPKNNLKWARICEHIIRHYTEGWGDGFNYKIEYWEIWNEPDCRNWDGSNPCWQGTDEEFIKFYVETSRYLKEKFQHLKIGGPAMGWMESEMVRPFLKAIKDEGGELDFFSYHYYGGSPHTFKETIDYASSLLSECGFPNVEKILNEWNYSSSDSKCPYPAYAYEMERGIKGSSFAAAAMATGQANDVDMLMYYDARPCGMNGLFDTDNPKKVRDTYYSFLMFKDLRRLGTYVPTPWQPDTNIYSCAATNGTDSSIMFTHFNVDDTTFAKDVEIEVTNLKGSGKYRVQYFILNEEQKLSYMYEDVIEGDSFKKTLFMKIFTSCLVKITSM